MVGYFAKLFKHTATQVRARASQERPEGAQEQAKTAQGAEKLVLVLVPVCVLEPVWAFSSTYLRFGLEVVGSGIRGVQKTQRDMLATMVLIVLGSDDF